MSAAIKRLQVLIACVQVLTLAFSSFAYANSQIQPEMFAQLPDVSNVNLSPDGQKVVSLVRVQTKQGPGVVVLWVDLVTGEKKKLIASDNERFVVAWMEWANNDTLLLSTFYPTRSYGTPVTGTRLLKIDTNTAKFASAIPTRLFDKFGEAPILQDNIIDFLPDHPDEFLVALRTTNQLATEVYKVNHQKGIAKRVHRIRDKTLEWLTDRQNNLRIAMRLDGARIEYSHRIDDDSSWQPLWEFDALSADTKEPLGFGHNPNILYFTARHNGYEAVFKLDLEYPAQLPTLVYAQEDEDVSGELIYSRKSQRVVGMRYATGEGYVFWDAEFQAIQNSINRALPNSTNKIIDFSEDERQILVQATSDRDAGTYFYWDRDGGTMEQIARRYAALDPDLMAEKEAINYRARDGLEIQGYLTKPLNANPDAPLPAIVFPHGGPISYDGRGFDYWTQFFVNRGYAVLQMNFRGSYGYGYDFMASGFQDWGGKMQTDVEDGTRWMIEQGIADPKRICIVGASYGGYVALMEAANNLGLYQCAVSFAGVTDLEHLLINSRRYANRKIVEQQLGANRKKLEANSPVNRAAEISIPVLLAHGTKDLRVPFTQAKRMRKRMQNAGKEMVYLEFEEGNHYLSNEVHRVKLFKEMDLFLSKYLSR